MICCNIEQATEEHFTSIMFVKTGQNIWHGIDFTEFDSYTGRLDI